VGHLASSVRRIRYLIVALATVSGLAGCGDPVSSVWTRNETDSEYVIQARPVGAGPDRTFEATVPPRSSGTAVSFFGVWGERGGEILTFTIDCRLLARYSTSERHAGIIIEGDANVRYVAGSMPGLGEVPHFPQTERCLGAAST
jgi:hypothetical protein